MFRVIVTGGQDFQNYPVLQQTMDRLLSNIHDNIVIVSGKSRGADALGERYAAERGFNILPFPADWERYGPGADFVRNEEMAANAEALVAFWDGANRGIKHIIDISHRNMLKVRVVQYKVEP